MDKSLYPDLVALYEQRRSLDDQITAAMKATFLGRRVRVNHHHGHYFGVVRQVGRGEFSVMVRNDVTGKSTQRWPLLASNGLPDIELVDADPVSEVQP